MKLWDEKRRSVWDDLISHILMIIIGMLLGLLWAYMQ